MQANQWKFCGRYGDDESTITIRTMPDDLTDAQKGVLRKLYEGGAKELYDCGAGSDGYELSRLGLVEQVGNAWNHQLMWAPQVHAWMESTNTNSQLAAATEAQYRL